MGSVASRGAQLLGDVVPGGGGGCGPGRGRDRATHVDELGLTFTIPMDGEQEVGERYGVMGLPTTFFIDENGVIRTIWMGEMNSVTLAENVSAILR